MSTEPESSIDARRQVPVVLYVDVYPYRFDPATRVPRFLALKRRSDVPLADSWQPASGKLRAGERISVAFSRIVHAKTGQSATQLWSLDELNTFYDATYDAVLMVPAAAAELSTDAVILQDDCHCEHAWVTAYEARQMFLFPSQHACLVEIERALATGLEVGRYKFRQLDVSK